MEIIEETVTTYTVDGIPFDTREAAAAFLEVEQHRSWIENYVADKGSDKPDRVAARVTKMLNTLRAWEAYKANPKPTQAAPPADTIEHAVPSPVQQASNVAAQVANGADTVA